MSEAKIITIAEAKARVFDPSTIRRLESNEIAKSEALTLIPEIEDAFAGVPRPIITLRVARAYDDEWNLSDERVEELRSQDPKEDWHQVRDEAIEGNAESAVTKSKSHNIKPSSKLCEPSVLAV